MAQVDIVRRINQRKLPVIVGTTVLFVICVTMIWATFQEQKHTLVTAESSKSLNHSKLIYSLKTITETTALARHSSADNVTEQTPPTGWEAHVRSKQSLPTVPSIPADMPRVGSKQSLPTVPSIPADMPRVGSKQSLPTVPSIPADMPRVGSKQSLPTVPSIPADMPRVGSKQSLPTVPSIPADMPFPRHIKSREELQKTECMSTLYNFLLSLDKSVSPHVNMVFGDSEHAHLVMNWIIAAMLRLEPPLHNVMVISLDRLLCDTLTAKKLPLNCIVVSVECIFTGQHADWRKRMMVRQPVLRLINYWGYDVAAYDSDAVLLRNPQPLYDERPHVSLLASSGTMPKDLSRKWGFALCAGALILRASPSVGK